MFNKKETDVLLIEKQHPEWQKGRLNGIGGKREDGEISINAMVREFEEETGIETNTFEWRYVVTIGEKNNWQVDGFTCFSDKVFDFVKTTDETPILISLSELSKFNVISNIYWLVELCRDRKASEYTITNNMFI